MEILTGLAKFGIYAAMFVSVIAALGAIMLANLFHAALCFVVVLVGIAIVFLAAHAEFLAVVQILIYVGAIMTLVIFAIMMTSKLGEKAVVSHNKLSPIVFVGGATFFIILMRVIFNTVWTIQPQSLEARVSAEDLGLAIMQTHVFPFEVIAIFLTAALVGAIVITRKEKVSKK